MVLASGGDIPLEIRLSCSSIAVSFARMTYSSSSCSASPGARNQEATKPVKVPKRPTPAVMVSAATTRPAVVTG